MQVCSAFASPAVHEGVWLGGKRAKRRRGRREVGEGGRRVSERNPHPSSIGKRQSEVCMICTMPSLFPSSLSAIRNK